MAQGLLIDVGSIDGPLLLKQRVLLDSLIERWENPEEQELLAGLENLLDRIADELYDKHGVECLMTDPEAEADHEDLRRHDALGLND